ncbi:FMN-dependent alpha-hydroxy acid dehydrogenase [Suillus paluster]|uniref:FMN-dependent alpha-hydroxy acid dehydrogenase n=1 Tax=Suillus paluster TaxID=48578 RepID=UPI001B869658|nr:FMN-dependent alpha-hydroxy acid dehydrogenase [Suillus paluster]KAG1727062.1 FMN-dependent alpha-hydroxy acid dehydrogenase [Suillus paluster]
MTAVSAQSTRWTKYFLDIYGQAKPPVLGSFAVKEIEDKAREVMKDHLPAYMYTFGSAGTCSTDAANRRAFDRWKIVPAMLKDCSNRSVETKILGEKFNAPVFVSPVGVQGILHADGEIATAKAAAACGIPYIMSSASSRSIEDIAKANGPNGQRWYQLYWPRTDEITISLLNRAKAAGFTALVITLDTMVLGWRPHDLDTAYIPFLYGVGVQVGLSDPVFMKRYGYEPVHEKTVFPFNPEKIRDAALKAGDATAQKAMKLGKEWLGETNSGSFRSWDDLQFIKDNWDGPIILKGILRASDAEKAIDMGIHGIIVSNHGGRQIDGSIGALDALSKIMRSPKVLEAQNRGDLTVLFDSGIRTGSDVIKAMAIGAQGVLIARPYMYGLAIAGQAGVEQILMQTVSDMHITMGLCGYSDVNDLIGKRDELLERVDD